LSAVEVVEDVEVEVVAEAACKFEVDDFGGLADAGMTGGLVVGADAAAADDDDDDVDDASFVDKDLAATLVRDFVVVDVDVVVLVAVVVVVDEDS
jgi:hypothetical protein